jgi:hypothetical protein
VVVEAEFRLDNISHRATLEEQMLSKRDWQHGVETVSRIFGSVPHHFAQQCASRCCFKERSVDSFNMQSAQ